MSRFLLLSDDGCGVGLAVRLESEGHSVRTWIKHAECEDYGRGIITRASEYEYCKNVIADCTNFGAICDTLRQAGIGVFAGSTFADKLEEDREFAEALMHDAGIDTPQSVEARSWEDAEKAVKKLAKHSGKVVIKPEGKLSGVVPSQVAADVDEGLSTLKAFQSQSSTEEPELTIQEFVEGVAVSTEGWFDGKEWIEGMFNHTLEKKETQNGDLGPSTGCAGNVVWRCDSRDPIVSETLTKLTKALRAHEYIGPFDINCVVSKDGVYGLEFTPRFGYDAFPSLLYGLYSGDFGSFVSSVLNGNLLGEATLKDGFAVGVRLVLPKDSPKMAVGGLERSDFEWFYPYGIQWSEVEGFSSVKDSDHLGVVNHYGSTVGEAFARAYDICSKIRLRGLGYRTDLSDALLKDYRKLEEIFEGGDGGWYGVDLDGTLADYSEWNDEIGQPLPVSIQRVKRQISEGKEVRIVTARGTIDGDGTNRHQQIVKIHEWVKTHIGTPLEVQAHKDPKMIRLDDDRVRQVNPKDGSLMHASE